MASPAASAGVFPFLISSTAWKLITNRNWFNDVEVTLANILTAKIEFGLKPYMVFLSKQTLHFKLSIETEMTQKH